MGKTANRLREIHPSRASDAGMVHLVAVTHLLRWHLGPDSAHVQPDDVNRLMVAIALATAEQARRDAGDESRKKSLEALRAMLRMPDAELVATLQTCDMTTFGRIQTAHAELYAANNGVPVVEITNSGLSDDDLLELLDGDDPDKYRRVVEALGTPPNAVLSEDDRVAALQRTSVFLRSVAERRAELDDVLTSLSEAVRDAAIQERDALIQERNALIQEHNAFLRVGDDVLIRTMDALNGVATDAGEADSGPSLPPPIELPRARQPLRRPKGIGGLRDAMPLRLPMGIGGLRDAISNAITSGEQEANDAGNKPRPHMEALAKSCEVFIRQHPPAPNWPGLRKTPPSPAVSFTTDVFKLAGMDRIGDSRIERLLTAARKSLDWRPKTSK